MGKLKRNWDAKEENTIVLSEINGDFSTLNELISYLSTLTQTEGILIQVDGGHFPITDTLVIDFTMPVKFQGAGSNNSIFQAAAGLLNKNMFDIKSNCDFASITFDGSTLAGWSGGTNASFLVYSTDGIYSEVTDFVMYDAKVGFDIIDENDIFAFNFIIENVATACKVNSLNAIAIDFEIGNIENCNKGFDFIAASDSNNYLSQLRFIQQAGQTAVTYNGSNYNYTTFSILSCEYNNVGSLFVGFDFTLQRDANVEIKGCIGEEDKDPHGKINIYGNTTPQSLPANTWTKLNFVNTESYSTKFAISNNKYTFLSDHKRDFLSWASGNLSTTSQPAILELGIVKNGNTATVYGKQKLYLDTNNRSFVISENAYIDGVGKNDYFELYGKCNANESITVEDLNWLVDTK